MENRKPRGTLASLALACHPLPTAAMTVAVTVAAWLSGRPPAECALVAVTVLSGQLTIGWINDVVDRDRDREVGRSDKPVAAGWIDPGTVVFATACMVLLVIPLSFANGTYAGVAHLLAVGSAWLYPASTRPWPAGSRLRRAARSSARFASRRRWSVRHRPRGWRRR